MPIPSTLPTTPGSNAQSMQGTGALEHSPQAPSHVFSNISTEMLDMSVAAGIPMPMPDIAWSPALADEIGWDWGDFSLLFTEPGM